MTPPPTERPPGVLRLAGPLILSFWLRSAFQWVDTIYASSLRDLGDASIAAIGLTAPFEFLMIACWVGSSNGLTSRLAAAMGARQGAKIEQLLGSTRRILRGLRALFIALAAGIWFAAPHLGLDEAVAGQFRIYGTVLLGGSAFTAFWSVLPDSLVKAHNDTRSTMWAGLASTVANFVMNTVFVFVFHWGILGIALATVLARLAGLAYATRVARLHEERRLEGGRDGEPGLFARPTKAILILAVPAGLSFALLALEGMAINAIIAARADSAATLAAWSIIDRAGRFLSMPIIAVGVALLPLCARLWGARDFDAIRRELRASFLASIVYSLAFAIPLTLLLAEVVATSLTDAPEAQVAARRGLALVGLVVLVSGPTFFLRSAFDGMQQPRPGLVVSAIRSVVLIVPLAALGLWLAPRLGLAEIDGLVIGIGAGAAGATALLAWWMRTFLRLECRPDAPEG